MNPVRWAADTIIRSGHMRMYTPSSAASDGDICRCDTEMFVKSKGCSMFIREAGPNEYENGYEASRQMNLTSVYLEMPKLWVLVFGDEALYFSVPVYRGEKFFRVRVSHGLMIADTASDRATRILLAEMDSRGGIETEAFESWKTRFLGAIAQHNQKALKPSEAIN